MKKNLIFSIIFIIVLTCFKSLAQPNWQIVGNALTKNGTLGSKTNFGINFITNNATRMTLTKAGFLGVGTTTPNTVLNVANGGQITLTSGGNIVSGLTSGQNLVIGTGQIAARNNGAGGTLFLNVDGGGDIHTGGNITPNSDGAHTVGTSSLRWAAIWATDGTINTSDASLKENIQDLPYGLNEVMKLRPVSFTWKDNNDGHKRIGLIAQQVKSVVPEVVRDWESRKDEKTGQITTAPSAKLGLQYNAIIPVLIKAIQDQQQEINDYKNRLEKLEAGANRSIGSGSVTLSSISLEQNTPNPFNGNTIIQYNIPVKFSSAKIMITDYTGKPLKELNISTAGKGSLQVNASTLVPGSYTYSLIVDGKLVDSKKMVLSK
jgi:hypothetical protein